MAKAKNNKKKKKQKQLTAATCNQNSTVGESGDDSSNISSNNADAVVKVSRLAISTLVSRDRHVEMRTTVDLMAAEFVYSEGVVPWYIFSNGSSAAVCAYLQELVITQPHPAFQFVVEYHPVNMGCGPGINRAWMQSRHHEFVLFLEDDWLLVPHSWSNMPRDWASRLLKVYDEQPALGCVYLRTYVDPAESAWHYHLSNNQRNTAPIPHSQAHGMRLRRVVNFHYSNNPHLRRSSAFIEKKIYPLPEFFDAAGVGIEVKGNKIWGQAEIDAESRMHGMLVYDLNPGIFAHYDHWYKKHWSTVSSIEDDDDDTDVVGCGRYRDGDSRLTCKYGYAEVTPQFCLACDHGKDLRDLRPHYFRFRELEKEIDKSGAYCARRETVDIEDLATRLFASRIDMHGKVDEESSSTSSSSSSSSSDDDDYDDDDDE